MSTRLETCNLFRPDFKLKIIIIMIIIKNYPFKALNPTLDEYYYLPVRIYDVPHGYTAWTTWKNIFPS